MLPTCTSSTLDTYVLDNKPSLFSSTDRGWGSRVEQEAYISIRRHGAAIRPGPRQRNTQMSVGMGKGYTEGKKKKKMVLISSLGFQEATSGAIWPQLMHEKKKTHSSSSRNLLQQRRKATQENSHIIDCAHSVPILSFVRTSNRF